MSLDHLLDALEEYRVALGQRWKAGKEEESEEERAVRQRVEILLGAHLTDALHIVNADRPSHAQLFFHAFTYPGRDHDLEIIFTDDPFASFFEDSWLLAERLRPHIPICSRLHVRMRFKRGL